MNPRWKGHQPKRRKNSPKTAKETLKHVPFNKFKNPMPCRIKGCEKDSSEYSDLCPKCRIAEFNKSQIRSQAWSIGD